MQNKLIVRVLALACLISLVGCSGSNGGGSGGSNNLKPEEAVEVKHPLFMDELGVVPTKGSYIINVNNLSDKNYTLDSIKVTDGAGNDQSNLLSVSGQMCKLLVANGSCSIEFSPKTSVSAAVLLTVNLRDSKNELHVVNQLIRVSDQLSSEKGISFETEVGDIVTENGDYSITIPVVLNEDFDKVEAFNGSLSCGSNGSDGFKKGSTCTYHIGGHALADNTIVSADIKGYRGGKLVAEKTENLNVRIAYMPDLIMSQGVSLTADGTTGQEIIVYNDGNEEATDISYDHMDTLPLGEITGSCGTIQANKTCTIVVKATSTTHGSGRLTALYEASSRKAGTNISYTGIANVGVEFTERGDSFNDLLANNPVSAKKIVTIKNTGKNSISKIQISLVKPNKDIAIINGDDNTCKNITSLQSGASCDVQVEYTAGSYTVAGEAQVLLTGEYVGTQGQPTAYSARHSIAYSTIDSASVLTMSVAPRDMKIKGDGGEEDTQYPEILRTNVGTAPVTLKSLSFDKTSINGLSLLPAGEGLCSNDLELTADKPSCKIGIKYGPVSGVFPALGLKAKIEYEALTQSHTIYSSSFDVVATQPDLNHAKVSLDDVISSGGASITGEGTSLSPFNFIALKDSPLTLTYTFKNTGTGDANKMHIGAGSNNFVFPYGASVTSNECGDGSAGSRTITLEAGATCDLVVTIPDEHVFNDIAHANNNLPIQTASVKLPLSISYVDSADDTLVEDVENSKYVSFSRDWAAATYSTKSVSKLGDAWHIELKATVDPKIPDYPITVSLVKTDDNHLNHATNLTTCTITGASNNTCEGLSFDLPFDSYPEAGGKILLETEVTADLGAAKGNAVRSNYTVTYDNQNTSASFIKMWSKPKFNNEISHGAGEKLPFEVKLLNVAVNSEVIVELTNKIGDAKLNNVKKCSSLAADGSCIVSGVIQMPPLIGMKPGEYDMELSITVKSGDVTTHRTVVHEVGQYVQTFHNNTPYRGEAALSGNVNFKGIDSTFKGFTSNLDNVLLSGPMTLNNDSNKIKNDSYNALNITAIDVTGKPTSLVLYVAIHSFANNNIKDSYAHAIHATGDVSGCLNSCVERLRFRTFVGDKTVVYQGTGQGSDYHIINGAGVQDLNKNLPDGHYVATFYLVRDEQPIKIDLDWDKKDNNK